MNCSHAGTVYWDNDTEELYCRRCGEVLDELPMGWTEEDLKEVKNEI